MLAMLVILSSLAIRLYEVPGPVNPILLQLESPDRLHPSLSWMHLFLLPKLFQAELGNTH